MGRKFISAGHRIVQVAGRNSLAASKLAYEFNTVSTNYTSSIVTTAEIYIIAVSDNAIAEVIRDLRLPGKLVVHTAAAVPKEILHKVTEHYGVFYPLQSLRLEMERLPDIPVFFDASDGRSTLILEKLAHSIAGEKVVEAGIDERLKLHIAAVFAGNFTNYMYVLAADYCRKEQIDFRLLQPLIEETALRVNQLSPASVQTGPAIRHDSNTLKSHLDALMNYPELQNVYAFLSEQIGRLAEGSGGQQREMGNE